MSEDFAFPSGALSSLCVGCTEVSKSSQNACDIGMIQLYPLNLRKHIHASIWAIAILIYHHYHHLVSLSALQAMETVQNLEIYTPNNNRIMLRHYEILYFLIRMINQI